MGHPVSTRQKNSGHKNPNKGGSYWLWGHHAVEAALANPERRVKRLVATKNAAPKTEGLRGKNHPKLEEVDNRFFERVAPPDAVHQGVAAEVEPLAPLALGDVIAAGPAGPLLLLDQVTDPHNVGAILRSAAAFGAVAVIVTANHTAPEGAVLAKAASGAMELVPVVPVVNLSQAMQEIKKAGY